MKINKEKYILWTLLFILGVLSIYQLKYRLNHPEMTETQLFLHFFDAFKG